MVEKVRGIDRAFMYFLFPPTFRGGARLKRANVARPRVGSLVPARAKRPLTWKGVLRCFKVSLSSLFDPRFHAINRRAGVFGEVEAGPLRRSSVGAVLRCFYKRLDCSDS